jgi:hypothetical protein
MFDEPDVELKRAESDTEAMRAVDGARLVFMNLLCKY